MWRLQWLSSYPDLTHEVGKRGDAVPQLGLFLWSQGNSSQSRGSAWAHAAGQAEEHLSTDAAPALNTTLTYYCRAVSLATVAPPRERSATWDRRHSCSTWASVETEWTLFLSVRMLLVMSAMDRPTDHDLWPRFFIISKALKSTINTHDLCKFHYLHFNAICITLLKKNKKKKTIGSSWFTLAFPTQSFWPVPVQHWFCGAGSCGDVWLASQAQPCVTHHRNCRT